MNNSKKVTFLTVISLLCATQLRSAVPADPFPLHYAARTGDLERVQELISGGANVDEQNKGGDTPLHQAAEMGDLIHSLEIVRILVAAGTDVNKQNKGADTPLHYAAEKDIKMVQILIAAGADVNKQNKVGQTSLHRAAIYGHPEIIKTLIKHGGKPKAGLDLKDISGNTPLHKAVQYNNENTVRELIRAGADTKIKNDQGDTAELLAIAMHRSAIAAIFQVSPH